MLKKNKLFVIVALVYMVLFVTMPEKANEALGNSVYYLIEMLEVLPVIFLLTVVIEVLIPKEWIMKHFGENSGLMGNLLSLLLGSISAGPIYAAFPISKTLLGKGASVSNIVIILSTWAVIKIPMLANEAKFLGASFMGIRWVLTVIAILLMAWVIGKIVSKKELITETLDSTKSKVYVNEDYCVGCGICSKMLPEVYKIVDRKAKVNLSNIHPSHRIMIVKTIEKCPTKAIVMNMDRTSVH
ncbi:permease [Sinanaerobacter chloroacetimidivorans]|uniref:Permease n=1 Tax=Sinanaerobacter chloroacetimidivorans TaxID=2818044 RepID=A0A8J7W2L8_9FIRM|nr:permease [Sinanaerobacter chloroacetimidivorans]MBR0599299.1 permease [Sinanaerobacter chloroacetimidivorans]